MKLRHPLRSARIGVAVLAAALCAAPAASAAEKFYATTPENTLISFTSQAPNRILDSEPINGLLANETIVGMDTRPATGQLYALTSTGRILIINRSSGDTKFVAGPLAIVGTTFGFDFNPVADAIRITSDTEQNFRYRLSDGTVFVDGPLAYGAGDAGAGSNPTIGAAAYTNSVFGAAAPATTTLLAIDSARDTLVSVSPPNVGTLTTVGSLGLDATELVHYDIAADQTGYAAFSSPSFTGVRLYSINQTTGTASIAAASPRIGRSGTITSLTAVGQVTDDVKGPAVAVGNYSIDRSLWLSRGVTFTLSCAEDCISVVTLRVGTRVVGTTTVTLEAAGTKVARIALTSFGRRVIAAADGRVATSLTFSNRDFANQRRVQVARFVSID
ncbi:MAG: hypothetical protein JWM86_243 [Thermoleophilia bacterium]|nr:hypothetical protein [Thermoleophilia bacterium]